MTNDDKALVERLLAGLEIADEYILNLRAHEGAEGFSVSTNELESKYLVFRESLVGDKTND